MVLLEIRLHEIKECSVFERTKYEALPRSHGSQSGRERTPVALPNRPQPAPPVPWQPPLASHQPPRESCLRNKEHFLTLPRQATEMLPQNTEHRVGWCGDRWFAEGAPGVSTGEPSPAHLIYTKLSCCRRSPSG